MNESLNPAVRTELQLDQAARSVWETLFRWGVYYLGITTSIGTFLEAIYGEHKGRMPFWGWALVGPYLFFMVYCSNYAVGHFVKSTWVRWAWWLLMGFIAFVLVAALVGLISGAFGSVPSPTASLGVTNRRAPLH